MMSMMLTTAPPEEFIQTFPGLVGEESPFTVSPDAGRDATALDFSTLNITRDVNHVNYQNLRMAFGWWECTLTNALGSQTETSFITDDSCFSCSASVSDSAVTIDCSGTAEGSTFECSFNDGPSQACTLPLVVTGSVSPPGSHSVRVVASTGDEDIVIYNISDVESDVPGVVPPLTLSFINDSPHVQQDSVEADVVVSRPVQSLICRLRGDNIRMEEDCSSGSWSGPSGLTPAVYTLRVIASNSPSDKTFITTRFEVTDDTERCTLHLINSGVSVSGDSAVVEFAARGPATEFTCYLDKTTSFSCSSPVSLTELSRGRHILKVVPSNCGRNKMNLKTAIIIE